MTKNEFNIYIGEIHGRMLRFAKSILRSEADAQDVVSKVSETLWRERERLEATSSASSFAMTSVRNGCYDHARYRSRRLHEEPSEELISDESDERGDTIELIRFAMSQLPERQREVLHLKDIEGYCTQEIAEILGIETTNVRMILSRARAALRDIVIKNMQQ